MIYSRSVEYAIRALVHLAVQPEGKQRMARQIANEEDIPSFFLAKTLQQLARKGLLHSVKGPTGGFGLQRAPEKISLMDIICVLDGPESFDRCIVGLDDCTEESPCPMDRSFRPIRREIVRYLTKTTVADLANGSSRPKRFVRAEPPPAKARKRRRSR
jgi:Rrf2 family protein